MIFNAIGGGLLRGTIQKIGLTNHRALFVWEGRLGIVDMRLGLFVRKNYWLDHIVAGIHEMSNHGPNYNGLVELVCTDHVW